MGEPVFDIAVIGLGYIGLPTAATFASRGQVVAGVDVNRDTVDAVNRGEVPFVEPELGSAVSEAVSAGLLKAFTDVPEAHAYIIAVPTPITDSKDIDLSYLRGAAEHLAPVLRGGELVILESTSPPGTTEKLAHFLERERPDLRFGEDAADTVHVAHSPERVLPGRIMVEIVSNDRVVGGLTNAAGQRAKKLYGIICQGQIYVTDAATAEMTKIAENSFRDLNIAFANQLSLMCEGLDVSVWELIELANHHPRVNILQPGPGVGGHCIAVDPWFLVSAFPEHSSVTRAARELNDSMPANVVRRIQRELQDRENATVALLGLTFKANVDDSRESPAVRVVELLAAAMPMTRLLGVDPHVETVPGPLQTLANFCLESETDKAVQAADLVVLLVDHAEFLHLRLSDQSQVIDTRGVWGRTSRNSDATSTA
ncbi:UDP-N-acetyl-D-mannosamine dehydrogenase [Arthrobacter sp.]|uniref:UDP-N-acetyl-D-mannosamine dehydrogenase n=1 Tax=Arthrobacter sp. TaxID=1667 RepID=UPI0028A1AA12|nr:UDP-N-acetyl-D-mannosamine dehydrogenase [Arthrobacter sp.]